MQNHFSSSAPSRSPQWLRVILVSLVLGLAVYGAWQRQRQEGPAAAGTTAQTDQPRAVIPAPTVQTTIHNQTIRDSEGRIVFRGNVEVGPTLERINHGDRMPYSHDGIVFQNRERRRPQKPASYYHEFIHPTHGLSGPGPQRIIVGREGEVFYTPDHYRTFQRLDE